MQHLLCVPSCAHMLLVGWLVGGMVQTEAGASKAAAAAVSAIVPACGACECGFAAEGFVLPAELVECCDMQASLPCC